MAENKNMSSVGEPGKVTEIESFEVVDQTLNKSEQFVEDNSKVLSLGLLAVILLVLGYFLYKNYYSEPREVEARNAIYKAEQWFARDSFRLALEGDENFDGFEKLIDDYGSTEAGRVAKLYAGLCHKNLGNIDEAMSYLKSFDVDDELVSPAVVGSIGDCYLQKDDKAKAIDCYKKAASVNNELITPVYLHRAAMVYLSMGKKDDARKLFEEIKSKYSSSSVASDIDKYIAATK